MTDERLARALGTWATTHRVQARDRDRMRTAILLTPQVDALWWDQFNQQMARLASRTLKPAAGPMPDAGWDEVARMGWGAGA